MKLEWMGEYRDVVEQLIKYCNHYAVSYKKERKYGTDIPISFAQIQVVEYLLENEELHQNMSEISARLGISNSQFTKLTDKLVAKGLLERFRLSDNKKDVIVQVTEYGREIYGQYADAIYKYHFSKMFAEGEKLPKAYLPIVAKMLSPGCDDKKEEEQETPVLVPLERKE